jgi:hypothetical protein
MQGILTINYVLIKGITLSLMCISVGVLANLTIWVYNLSYSSILRDKKSSQFLHLANPFCDDVSRFMYDAISNKS